jgi:phenylalanyl-tRNA synthetase alpha chain
MKDRFEQLRREFETDLKRAENVRDVEQLQVKYLGRKGPIQGLMQDLRNVPSEERPFFGKLVNELKQELERLCEQGQHAFRQAELAQRIQHERIDVTLPGRKQHLGRLHPVSRIMDDVLDVFSSMGFSVQLGPDVDTDYYNFEGLNFAPDHPARDMQDTFYVSKEYLLRTHTSNTQLRVMEKHRPPIRVVMPGTTYRNETVTARSHVFFHQVEGMYIDKGVTFADLLSTMEEFWTRLFKMELKMRFRPSYFPFVEPGMEVDISCISCKGTGCRLCKFTGWLEVCGAGMIHPVVLRNGGIDPEVYSGYAWGMGVERPAILRWGITDIRDFFENDHRFLAQF